MGLSLQSAETFKIVSRRDDSVGCDEATYSQYLKTLDESLLELKTESNPTRFVLRKVLPFAARQRIKNEQISYKGGSDVEIRMGFVMEEMRAALVGVENAGSPNLEYKKENDGLASKELIAVLDAYGILDELYLAYQAQSRVDSVDKKKSTPS